MTKFRTALLALTLALTIAGGAGAASQAENAPSGTAVAKNTSMRVGDSSWCC